MRSTSQVSRYEEKRCPIHLCDRHPTKALDWLLGRIFKLKLDPTHSIQPNNVFSALYLTASYFKRSLRNAEEQHFSECQKLILSSY